MSFVGDDDHVVATIVVDIAFNVSWGTYIVKDAIWEGNTSDSNMCHLKFYCVAARNHG